MTFSGKSAHINMRAFKEIANETESVEVMRQKLKGSGLNLTSKTFYECLRNLRATKTIIQNYTSDCAIKHNMQRTFGIILPVTDKETISVTLNN